MEINEGQSFHMNMVIDGRFDDINDFLKSEIN